MDDRWLTERFEAHRERLWRVAYRTLGSAGEADDAVQEAWLRLARSDADSIDNLGGWLTTVVGRVCLDMLRARRARRETPLEAEPASGEEGRADPADEALRADSVGAALLMVLETLAPAERLAFVLHDVFAVPFDEIAIVLDRSPGAAKMLASRARRRVRAAQDPPTDDPPTDLARRHRIAAAFLAAARDGDFDALLALLDPDVTARADADAVTGGIPVRVRGAQDVARQALAFARHARSARPVLVDGNVGIVVAPRGRIATALILAIQDDKIVDISVVTDPERLTQLDYAPLEP